MRLKREWTAAFFILIICWCSYEGYEGFVYAAKFPFYLKHIINFILLTSVGLIGYTVWSKDDEKWTRAIWLMLYLTVIALMILVGVLDLFFKFRIGNFREMIHNLRLFFTSPVPFGVLLFLRRRYKKDVLKE